MAVRVIQLSCYVADELVHCLVSPSLFVKHLCFSEAAAACNQPRCVSHWTEISPARQIVLQLPRWLNVGMCLWAHWRMATHRARAAWKEKLPPASSVLWDSNTSLFSPAFLSGACMKWLPPPLKDRNLWRAGACRGTSLKSTRWPQAHSTLPCL